MTGLSSPATTMRMISANACCTTCCLPLMWARWNRNTPTFLAWLENDLPDEESQLLNTHVADCDECREKLALMNAVHDVGEVGQ